MKKLALYLLMLLIVLGVLEALLLLVSRLVFEPRGWTYEPPTRVQFEAFLREGAHPRLGWLPDPAALTPAGYRIAPDADQFQHVCVSIYGDSFTFAAEVDHRQAWGNLLGRDLGCRVDNYGVIGYGSDQALLRFLDNSDARSPVAILAHLSENIARNVNQDFTMLYTQGIALHPVFVQAPGGGLERVPMPRLQAADHAGFVADPGRYLHHEYFLPNRSSLSKRTLGFPYTLSVAKLVTSRRRTQAALERWLLREAWYAELYEPDHPSGALQVTTGILTEFARTARERGIEPLVFVLPTGRDLAFFRARGRFVHRSLIDALERASVAVYDIGPRLLERIGDAEICDYFCTKRRQVAGHYGPRGNRVLAEVAHEILSEAGLDRVLAGAMHTHPEGDRVTRQTGDPRPWPDADRDAPGALDAGRPTAVRPRSDSRPTGSARSPR